MTDCIEGLALLAPMKVLRAERRADGTLTISRNNVRECVGVTPTATDQAPPPYGVPEFSAVFESSRTGETYVCTVPDTELARLCNGAALTASAIEDLVISRSPEVKCDDVKVTVGWTIQIASKHTIDVAFTLRVQPCTDPYAKIFRSKLYEHSCRLTDSEITQCALSDRISRNEVAIEGLQTRRAAAAKAFADQLSEMKSQSAELVRRITKLEDAFVAASDTNRATQCLVKTLEKRVMAQETRIATQDTRIAALELQTDTYKKVLIKKE